MLAREMKTRESLWKLMKKNFWLAHFQMTNTLTIVLICCLIRNLSYYRPRKPETSPYRLQIQQARERISYLFLFCISTKKEARYQFLFLNCLSCLCPHQALLLKKVNKWCYCCNIDYLWYFLCPLGIIHIIIGVPDDESDEEVPLAIPLYPNADGICCVVHNSGCFRVKNDLLRSSISDWFNFHNSYLVYVVIILIVFYRETNK